MTKTVRCTPCGAEFDDAEIKEALSCPTCGSKGVPMSISKDRQITINEHELHILGTWASWWAEHHNDDQMHKVLGGIFHRIKKQVPGIRLSLSDDLQVIAEIFDAPIEAIRPDGTVTEYRPRPKN